MEVETAGLAAFINVAIENVINFSRKMPPISGGLHKNVAKLCKSVETAQMILNNVETRTITTTEAKAEAEAKAVEDWLKKLGAVVLDADNVVDELKYHLLPKDTNSFKPSTITAKVLTHLPSPIPDETERSLALRINEINDNLESINKDDNLESINKEGKDAGILNARPVGSTFEMWAVRLKRGGAIIKKIIRSQSRISMPSLAHASGETDPIFVGRDDDVLTLADKLIANTTEQQERVFSILAILGKSGMGKTTLAKKIFDCESIMTRFGESRIWVHVGQAFDPIFLFKKILETFTSDPAESKKEEILKRLQQAFIGKTYLLVLHDVWNHDAVGWQDFLNSMNGVMSTKGNAIIITTRDTNVAHTVKPFHIHQPDDLSEEECWSIIKNITFGNQDVQPDFEEKGKEIAQRCGALPFAAYLVGGILRGKTQEHWALISEKLRAQNEQELTSEILRLSFQNLSPSSLKMCFAYCSIFPKGHKIVKQELIELWMAEGFLQSNEEDDMERVGGTFSDVLVHNSMLQVAEKDENGNAESFVMHDLLHDLASSCYNARGLIPVRYLTLHEKSSPVAKEVAKHVRTLFVKGEISDNMLSDYPSLRTLSLTRVKELPTSVKKLKHLRNLNISESWITQLPEWIGELHNLQTLRADTNHLWKLPSTLKYLINLRHLYVLSHVKLPAEMGRLTNLQTLRHFSVGENRGYQIENLKILNNLKGELHIFNLEKVRNKEEAVKANMHRKQHLSELVFRWSDERENGTNDERVLEGLQPHPNLKKLGIRAFKGKAFPYWALNMKVQDGPQGSWVQLNNLIQITLSSCSECEDIPKLEHLSNLKSLSLIGLKKVRFMQAPFSNLMSLYIRGLEILEILPDWLFKNNPTLSKLEIIECPKLEKLPDGLNTLNSLEELNITGCQNMKIISEPKAQYSKMILRVLKIVGCGELAELPLQMVKSCVTSLEILELFDLRSIKNLPMVMGCLAQSSRLRELKIGCVPQFMNIDESWHFGSLQKLHLNVSGESSTDCVDKKVNVILQASCKSLTQLCFQGNEILKEVPELIQHLTLLSKLELHNLGIEELPEWFGKLSCLTQLSLSNCNKLKRLLSPETLKRLTNLRHLDIKHCPELQIQFEGCTTSHLTIKVDDRWIEPYTNEIVDGGISSAATKFLLKSLGNTFKLEKNSGNVGVIGDIEQLQKTLVTVQSYLNDAQNKSIGEENAKVWLIRLQEAAFSADNVSDEFNYSALHNTVKKLKSKAKYKVLSCFPSFNHILRQTKIAGMIKDINMGFESMIQKAEDFGVQSKREIEPDAADTSASSDSFTVDPIFIGRDNDVQKLVETCIPGNTIFSIFAIVGKGGVGKETLARTVINHEEVKDRFGSYVWVHVSRNFDPIVIFKKILSALTSETNIGGTDTEESILKKLQQALKGKTYILVLDDLWNEDDLKWKKFIASISRVTSTKGNAIIITTRESKVASLVKPRDTYTLSGLLDEDCWSIIKAKAFPNGDDVKPGHETIRDKIVKICQGLPLTANILGGVLSGKSEEEWFSITEKLLSYEENVFKMSFDRLPSSSLKMCFAYCSIFPKGCKIAKKELIELWMAEEFLQPNEGHEMESVGEMFSIILVNNSLLQVAERDAYGNALTYVMHDLVHDHASAVLCSTDDTNQVRSLFQGDESIPICLMRTLIFRGEKLDTTMFSGYKSLHALTLDCDRVKVLPDSIRTLKHLRNLNVSRTRIESLPCWIDELHYLQTLNASTESLRELPSTLKYLTRLRHLYLCHDVKLPAEMGGLTNLQALKFRVGEHKGYKIEELGRLNNLKQLSIYNLEKVRDKEEAEEANISKKQNLTELRFEWDTNIDGERERDKAVLEGLKPHPGLKMLEIAGFKGKSFPSWAEKMSGFDKLIEIALSDCQGCEQIPELGRLPNLKTLSLWRLSKVTSINFSFEKGMEGVIFPKLETLLLTGMPELEVIQEFGEKVKVFPMLVSLKIFWCNKLECLPSLLFQKAHGLKVLDIRHCSKLSGLPDDLHTLDSLESMTIKGCQNLESIVNPKSIGKFSSLRSVEIHDCQELTAMVEPDAPLLKKVSMVELKSLQNLPKFLDSLKHSHKLAQLTIVGVPQFTSSINIWDFQKLRKLEIDVTMESSSETSDAIKKTVDIMLQSCLSSLGELKLTGLEIWDEVPESIKQLKALYSLELENFGENELPRWFEDLSHLKRLCLSNFPKLTNLPSMKRFTELQEFHICNCPKIKIEYEGLKISHRCAIYVNSHLV